MIIHSKKRSKKGLDSVAMLRDSVDNKPVAIVIGAMSETVVDSSRMGRARQIQRRAGLQGASHCLLVGDVIYLSHVAGISIAAQLEQVLNPGTATVPVSAAAQQTQVCVPLDSLVYLCIFSNGLVGSEQLLPEAQAETVLKKTSSEILVIAAGRLSARFAGYGTASDQTLAFSQGFRGRYCFRLLMPAMFYSGIFTATHLVSAATAAVAVTALTTGLIAHQWQQPQLQPQLQSGVSATSEIPQQAVTADDRSTMATAAHSLRSINRLVHLLAPLTTALGIERLQGTADMLRFDTRANDLQQALKLLPVEFEISTRNENTISWQVELSPDGPLQTPTEIQQIWHFIDRLRLLPGTESLSIEQQSQTVDATLLLQLSLSAPLAPALEYMAQFIAQLSANLVNAEIEFDRQGVPDTAKLDLEIRAVEL